MSVYFNLVLNSVARSNHHRIALLALQQLKIADADRWRDILLKHQDLYLEGAKAPDEQFKDFKNHVLHVREGDWGGAPAAAREWYKRAVRSMAEGDWPQAAWNAGVMSHYVVDPVQPFHTGQTEEEGVVHRAVEWSLSKCFPELKLILETELGGYPEVERATGHAWVEDMVRAGARFSNPYYETLIDHYDFAVGKKTPTAGPDRYMKEVAARLIGYASAMLARVLEGAFAESRAAPPKVTLALDAVFAVMSTPIRSVLASVADAGERALVAAQYEEFQRTGKVRATMSEDDKTIRALHAQEVLKTPLSSLDCQWPREVGTAHVKPPSKKANAAKPAMKLSKPPKAPAAQAPQPSPAPSPPPARPEPGAADAPASLFSARIRLTRDAPVLDAPSIGPKTADRLGVIGVRTVADLLALQPEEAASRIHASHINARVVRDWQAQAELACSLPDINSVNAQLLVAAGITSVSDLARADAAHLCAALERQAETVEGQRLLRGGAAPDGSRVAEWIAAARSGQARSTAA